MYMFPLEFLQVDQCKSDRLGTYNYCHQHVKFSRISKQFYYRYQLCQLDIKYTSVSSQKYSGGCSLDHKLYSFRRDLLGEGRCSSGQVGIYSCYRLLRKVLYTLYMMNGLNLSTNYVGRLYNFIQGLQHLNKKCCYMYYMFQFDRFQGHRIFRLGSCIHP